VVAQSVADPVANKVSIWGIAFEATPRALDIAERVEARNLEGPVPHPYGWSSNSAPSKSEWLAAYAADPSSFDELDHFIHQGLLDSPKLSSPVLSGLDILIDDAIARYRERITVSVKNRCPRTLRLEVSTSAVNGKVKLWAMTADTCWYAIYEFPEDNRIPLEERSNFRVDNIAPERTSKLTSVASHFRSSFNISVDYDPARKDADGHPVIRFNHI
jgi:hypothetical protein